MVLRNLAGLAIPLPQVLEHSDRSAVRKARIASRPNSPTPTPQVFLTLSRASTRLSVLT